MTHKEKHIQHQVPSFWIARPNPTRRLIQPPSELREKLAINLNDVAVDFACGPGYYPIELSKKAKRVVTVDLSPEILKKAQNKAERTGIKNIQFLQSSGINI